MATGGSGDVLTGLLAALIGQNLNVSDAARLAVYLHGLAGDIASKTTGQLGLIASDIIENLAGAMHHITSGADLHRDLYLHPNPTL
jgi:NAD(P)H-hydrate epimerase